MRTRLICARLREKDKKLHKALCKLLKAMLRSDPSSGSGKPEPLQHKLSDLWSKHLSQKDLWIYKSDNQCIYVLPLVGVTIRTAKYNGVVIE